MHPVTPWVSTGGPFRAGLADHAQACYGGSLGKSMKAVNPLLAQQGPEEEQDKQNRKRHKNMAVQEDYNGAHGDAR
jgi:hypothetical protein